MKVILTGGGSGGHVNPALAIANIIKKNDPESEILFVGTPWGIENDLVKKAGYRIEHVKISGVQRSLSFDSIKTNVKTAVRIFTSQSRARKIIKEFAPDIVIGTGGYVCWPCLKVAADMGIPTVLHEANAVPGIAVKMLCGKVDVVLTNFEQTAKDLANRQKTLHVGMPMRGEFEGISKMEARKRLGIDENCPCVLLSFGGSLGATKVNEAALEIMEKYTSKIDGAIHYHSSGNGEYDEMLSKFKTKELDKASGIELSPYIYDMSLKMAAADIVVCRAGASTISELTRLGSVAILIPSPNVTDNHQYKNAKVLADADAAVVIAESELATNSISSSVAELMSDTKRREKMSENIRKFYDVNMEKKIYSEIKRLVLEYGKK